MFFHEDHTYEDIRKRSLMAWLEEMSEHDDIAVRGGIRLCQDYIAFLEEKNRKLQEENDLKNAYLKKMSKRSCI